MIALARQWVGGIVVAALVGVASDTRAQTAVGTSLTYQAELRASGQPAAGPVDLRFRLFDALTKGTQIGVTIDRPNVALAQGRFTQELDFGAAAFGPDARFLQIDVRSPAGSGSYVTLSPRQRVTTAPVAQFALDAASAVTAVNAANATQFNGQSASFYQNAANLIKGTIPDERLAGAYTGALSFSNAGNVFTGEFSGSGSGLTGLNAAGVSQGLLAPAFGGTGMDTSAAATGSLLYAAGIGTWGVLARGSDSQVLTLAGGIPVWSNPSGLALPYSGGASVASPDPMFRLINTGSGIGLWGQADGSSGIGVVGFASATGGTNVGGHFVSDSTSGRGVFGVATAASGITSAGHFTAQSTTGRAVYGEATATTGFAYGGHFQAASPDGRAVFGQNTATTGWALGGRFGNTSPDGRAVYATASATSGTTYGVFGEIFSDSGRAVFGLSNHAIGGTGVFGRAVATLGGYGVAGEKLGVNGYGVFSFGDMGASGIKPFRIDHPDDPTHKYLLHYAAESPEVLNFYRGTVVLDGAGTAVVVLPAYFSKVNTAPSYQLTAVGAPMPMLHVAQKIDEGALSAGARAGPGDGAPACSFRIAGGAPGGEVSWRVEAVRNDRWVRQRGAPVEVEKQGVESGTYQHPELYGEPPEKGMNYDAAPEHPGAALAPADAARSRDSAPTLHTERER